MPVFDPSVYDDIKTLMKCPKCRGEGKIAHPFGSFADTMNCYVCNGIGLILFSRITSEDYTKKEIKSFKKELNKWGTEFLLVKKDNP